MTLGQGLRSALVRRLRATARVWRPGGGHLAMLTAAPPDVVGLRPQAGSIDWPASGSIVTTPVVYVCGWAATASGPCSRVELAANGKPLGRARLGLPRQDVKDATGIHAAELSGFEALVDLSELDERTVALSGLGIGVDGDVVSLGPVWIELEPSAVPLEQIDRAPPPRRSAARAPHRRSGALRLLVCTHQLDFGGAQLLLNELLYRIHGADQIEGVVLAGADGPTRDSLERLGLRVHTCPAMPTESPEWYESRIEELVAWIASCGCDAAFVNTILAFPFGDASARAGLPVVWAIHENYSLPVLWASYGQRLDPGVRVRAELALRASQAVVFTCEATRACYEPYLPSTSCVTLSYGVDVDALDRWRAGFDRRWARTRQGFNDETLVILCMATLAPHKGQVPLIHAFALVADRHPEAVLVLVGARQDAYTEAARMAVAAHGIEERVRIVPVASDVRPHYACADLMVSASDLESTPRSMLEAMALGLPVLGTRAGGVPELITDGETGWLCEPSEVRGLAEALDRTLSLDSGERMHVARNARALVERDHRSDVCSPAWGDLLREAAGVGKPEPSVRPAQASTARD